MGKKRDGTLRASWCKRAGRWGFSVRVPEGTKEPSPGSLITVVYRNGRTEEVWLGTVRKRFKFAGVTTVFYRQG